MILVITIYPGNLSSKKVLPVRVGAGVANIFPDIFLTFLFHQVNFLFGEISICQRIPICNPVINRRR
jgi:hypothetical protein